MKSMPGKTHFSSGQLKPQVSPPLAAAPSDSPCISPQNELSKSADLVMSLFCYKALTFSCCLEDKGPSPQPGMRFPRQQPCRSPGPLHWVLQALPAPGHPPPKCHSLHFWAFAHCLLCLMVQGSFPQKLSWRPG